MQMSDNFGRIDSQLENSVKKIEKLWYDTLTDEDMKNPSQEA